MSCKAKNCKYWKSCLAKRECCDFHCNDYEPGVVVKKHKPSPYERTKAAVYATGNKWAIENFHATHD